MPGEDARKLALEILLSYDERNAYLNFLLSSRLRDSPLAQRDRALVTEVVQGTVRMKGTVDWVLRAFSRRRLESLDRPIAWILRMSAYQVLFTSVPDYAACDLGATLARWFAGRRGASYVNGVLRALVRGKDTLHYPEPAGDPATYLEVRYSHPRWIAEIWMEELGFERAESLCKADNEARPVSIRCNLLKTTRDALAGSLDAQGVTVEPSGLVPEGLLLTGTGPVGELAGFSEGLFSVQDHGSILVGHVVAPCEGMEVLDMCAAPGGKANHLAELMRNRGRLVAIDVNRARLGLVEREARRLGNGIIETICIDAREVSKAIGDTFDRVLVDAPCSGLGTLSRRADARWRKAPADVERLALLQRELILEGSKMVKPGGLMVYSTCTISRRENEEVVRWLLSRDSSLEAPAVGGLPAAVDGSFVQLLPDELRCDGMFVAALRKGEPQARYA